MNDINISGNDADRREHDETGLIFNIQTYSIHDGPGIRTTVFMKGCPLRCGWCSNPDSWNAFEEIMTRDINCTHCGLCVESCSKGAITLEADIRKIDRAKCDLCLQCARICPNEAITISGRYITSTELVEELAKDRPFFRNSNGGITISGGEPLSQWKFVARVFKECKAKGIHTALDTSGYSSWDKMELVLEHVDLVLLDLKHMDPEIHKLQVAKNNKLILSNFQKTARKVRTWARIPVIPGFNDDDLSIRRIVDFLSTIPVEKVSLLPYHAWATVKYDALGREYPMKETQLLSDERIQEIYQIVTAAGLNCTLNY